jgi:hypothetical protein
MSLILHLSDLHLANTTADDQVGDYKIEAVPEEDRVTRIGLMQSTLDALSNWLVAGDEALDAVIITGDVTTRGRPEGFAKLPGLLAALGDALPEPGRIVVVPGNHDVTWDTPPGSAERYDAFIEGMRQPGYVTPLLDGVDYESAASLSAPGPLLIGPDFAIAAVNSADMCGVLEPFPADVEEELQRLSSSGDISASLQDSIRRVRLYDMPRISEPQMAAVAGLLEQVPAGLVRIAALHHQLAPVREEEEVKPFESIVNLGAFSAFLGDARIDVIAHGHKHADQVQVVTLGGPVTGLQRHAVAASCGTIGGAAGTGREIAKLIRIGSDLPTLRRVEILTVPAVGAGRSLRKITSLYDQPTWRPPAATPVTVISGESATDVHEQLLEAGRRADRKPMRDVICVVDNGSTALEPPASYPQLEASMTAPAEWFKEIVGWWQDPKRADGKPFTHGQRLYDWSGKAGDQVEAIIKILSLDTTTSRGVAILVNPDTDDITNRAVEFPSFSLLHFWIDDGALNCSAFFRKQEMTYWWAVNAAEIARIQDHVRQALRTVDIEVAAGAIRTHTSQAVFSSRLPKLNVPRIDRLLWQDPDSLRVLAVAVADLDMPEREKDIATFLSLMDDWAPQADAPPTDGAPVPKRGLAELAGMIAVLAARYPTSPAQEIGDLLRDMDEANTPYLARQEPGDAVRAYGQWRRPQLRRINRIHDLLAPQAVSPSGSATEPTTP